MHKVSTQDFLKIYLKWLSQLLINVRLLIILLLDELGAPSVMLREKWSLWRWNIGYCQYLLFLLSRRNLIKFLVLILCWILYHPLD